MAVITDANAGTARGLQALKWMLAALITPLALTSVVECAGNRLAPAVPPAVALPVLPDSARERGYGVILGAVLDSASGNPLEHGSVYVRLTRDSARRDAARGVPLGPVQRSGVPMGGFVVTHLAAGRYDVWARVLGYAVVQARDVVVRRDAVDTLVLRPGPSPIKLPSVVPFGDSAAPDTTAR